jgi:hypothetical protein
MAFPITVTADKKPTLTRIETPGDSPGPCIPYRADALAAPSGHRSPLRYLIPRCLRRVGSHKCPQFVDGVAGCEVVIKTGPATSVVRQQELFGLGAFDLEPFTEASRRRSAHNRHESPARRTNIQQ